MTNLLRIMIAVLTVVLLATAPACAAPNYIATPLGALGGTYSLGTAINSSGQITGLTETAKSEGHAFLHTAGMMTDLGTLGGTSSAGFAINDSGQVTGKSSDATGADRAFVYSAGAMTDLGTLVGDGSYGFSINAVGQITGQMFINVSDSRAFFYSEGSTTVLGALGEQNSIGYGINASGQVVGLAYTFVSPSRAFRYTSGTMVDLGTLGGAGSSANAINDDGQITGSSATAGGQTHAFLYTAETMTDLGTVPGGEGSGGRGLNRRGEVVGAATVSGRSRAFLYSSGTMYDLNSLVVAGIGAGETLTLAAGINDSGQIVATTNCDLGFFHYTDCRAYRLDPALTLMGAVSRKVHGAAGTYDLTLSQVALDPSTEPRQSSTATIVMTFDVPILSADIAVTEGTATAGTPTFSGNDVIVPLTGVADKQYVTISLTNVSSALITGGIASLRLGLLRGDVNQNRVVTVADLGLVNAQLSQPVTTANFLKDVNVSGAVTLADKGITNANLTKALPAP